MSADSDNNSASPFFPETDSLVGKVVLGRYRVVLAIGRGGMGVVYLARNEGAAGFVKPVVIKQTLPHLSDPSAKISAREARIMANLRHPGIVSVLDFAEEAGSYLLVLDYVHGYNMAQLNRYLRQSGSRFSWEVVCHVMANVLDALHYAHTVKGPSGEKLEIIHRDVSPSNVLVDVSGHIKLADFGIARMQNELTEASSQNMLKGKLSYLAPEVLQLEAPSLLSDVYACGVVLHELLIGKNEIRGEGAAGTVARALLHVLSPPSASRSDVPQALDAVVAKASAKDKALRYPTAQAFAQALRALQNKPEDELTALLAATVAADFSYPRIAGQIGSCDLSTLDRAWREPPTIVPPAAQPPSLSLTDAPTIGEEEPVIGATGASRRLTHKPWLWLAAGVGAAAVAAATTFAFTSRSQQPAPAPQPILVVQTPVPAEAPAAPSPNGTGAMDNVAPPTLPPAGAASEGSALPRTSSTTLTARARPSGVAQSTGRQSPADTISRAFAQKKGLVAQCFTEHPTDTDGPPMAVSFQIDEKGRVLSAKLLPAALGGTELASCIEKVARSTEFGPQQEAMSFRVPITARRVP